MVFHLEGYTTELTADDHALVGRVVACSRCGVTMNIDDVTHLEIGPSRHGVDESVLVAVGVAHIVHALVGVSASASGILSPAFVIYHPHAYRRVLLKGVHNASAFVVEYLLHLFFRAQCAASASVGHVLPHHESVAVAPLIPQVGLHLYMLAHHVHTERFYRFEVEDHTLVAWRCEQSVGPPALIERTIHVERLVVEHKCGVSVNHRFAELTHAEVALRRVGGGSVFHESELHIVEVWLVGRPQVRSGKTDGEVFVGIYIADGGHNSTIELHRSVHLRTLGGGVHAKCHLLFVDVGQHLVALNVCGIYRLEPHRLPYTAHGGVPYSARVCRLLAQWLTALVSGVVDGNHHLLLALGVEEVGYVDRERIASAAMISSLLPVDVHLALPVDGTEVHQHILPGERLGQGERAAVA